MDVSSTTSQQDAKTKLLKKLIVSVIKDGFQQLRMDDIAKHMDVSRATMYKHFSSKEDVISGVVRIIVDFIERLEAHGDDEDEAFFAVWFQKLFEQSVSLVQYITAAFMDDLKSAYPEQYNLLKSTLQKRDRHSLRFYRLGKDKGMFNHINESFILLQDELLLREITSVKYLLNHNMSIQDVLLDYYRFKKVQLFSADKAPLVNDADIQPIIEKLAEKFNRAIL
ncbi:TetR/AcrR family transcriptional regulator [Paenibacillus sacheonensis]|uniref:TetR family transcriptional regulator n=1 Tax=Paenibacillus sacheonensis TaxID=742054 RepID=A0A7X4YQ81_9BACL|nr:TetR/AcrR family transcriptional regulator [Paenibacillus sacheonensis]MBM7566331.1 AcrR family transcriptional regulator [Paenibacillus sacheonensis]NBC70535.1 TetR family transcriptional regulator [Paenibacillus sacheonensis]